MLSASLHACRHISQLVEKVRAAHAEAVCASPSGIVDRKGALALLRSVGLHLPDSPPTEELMDVMDADASGDVSLSELLVGIGMLRKQQLDRHSVTVSTRSDPSPTTIMDNEHACD